MRADLIIIHSPALDCFTGMVDIAPPMFIEALISHLSVKAFHVCVLIGFPWLDELMFDLVRLSPRIQSSPCELGAVVGEQAIRFTSKLDELIKHTSHIGSGDGGAHLHPQGFTGIIIDDVQ